MSMPRKRNRMVFPNTRRLLKLADLLTNLPPKRFDYYAWVGLGWKGARDLSCGTTACALGWATTIREWNLELLQTKHHDCVVTRGRRLGKYDEDLETSIAAGAEAFGLTTDESLYLFTPADEGPYSGLPESPGFDLDAVEAGYRPSAKQVAAHIRRFVRFAQKNRDVLRAARVHHGQPRPRYLASLL